jgi:Flp pilus assembly pilin Flp
MPGSDGSGIRRIRRGRRGRRRQEGQGVVEYGLILVLAIVVCVVSLLFFGDQLSSLLSLIASLV